MTKYEFRFAGSSKWFTSPMCDVESVAIHAAQLHGSAGHCRYTKRFSLGEGELVQVKSYRAVKHPGVMVEVRAV